MPQLSNRVNTFTDSVIRRMTRISDEYGAINLSQGFPDFDPPKAMLDALAKAAYAGRISIRSLLELKISGRHWRKSRERQSGERLIRTKKS